MRLYRAMCLKEFESISTRHPLSWNSRFKWFGTEEFVKNRVQDGLFNNSKYVDGRYKYLVEYEVVSGIEYFTKCGKREFMLNVRKQPLVKLVIINKYETP